MLNLASLLLGLAGWVLALGAIAKKGSYAHSIGSLTLCGAALVVQFFEIRRRGEMGDWSALMDTVPALAMVAALLLAVTLVLNIIALWKHKK